LVAVEDARKLAVRIIDFGVVGELGVQELEWLPDYSNRWFVFHTYSYQRCDTIQLILQKGQSSIQRINPNHRIVHRYFVVVGKVVGQQQVRVQLRRVERPRRRGTAFFFSDYF
jgi:hypothetical protein